mgnify:CR=1 FL=1
MPKGKIDGTRFSNYAITEKEVSLLYKEWVKRLSKELDKRNEFWLTFTETPPTVKKIIDGVKKIEDDLLSNNTDD